MSTAALPPSISKYEGPITVTVQQSPETGSLWFRVDLNTTFWSLLGGNHTNMEEQSSLDKYVLDPLTPPYNHVAYVINSYVLEQLGCKKLQYYIDQASAFKVLDKIDEIRYEKFKVMQPTEELAGLEGIFCNKKAMENYLPDVASKTRLFGMAIRDAGRGVAKEIAPFIHEYLPYYSFNYKKATPFTGLGGSLKTDQLEQDKKLLGRFALGFGYEPGQSEAGAILAPEHRGKGYGQEGFIALLVHAYVFKTLLDFPLGDTPLKSFRATMHPKNEKGIAFAKHIGATCIGQAQQPYTKKSRDIYLLQADKVTQALQACLSSPIEKQLTINGQPPSELAETWTQKKTQEL